jgi:2'-5' RNA ligase superfamily
VAKPVELTFGTPEQFSTHGVLLPCIAGGEAFQELRRHMLGRTATRRHQAHITLAHPRNPRATENVEENIGDLVQGVAITFQTVALIRQEGGRPWSVLSRYELLG